MSRFTRLPASRLPSLAVGSLVLLTACSFGGGAGSGPQTNEALLDHEMVDVVSGETFTIRELAADRPVLLETMAIWCTTCLRQQGEVARAHEMAEFHSVGINVDPNERAEDLARYVERTGFDWRFVNGDSELIKLLTDAYGFAVTNPPSTPTLVVSTDGRVRALPFGKVRFAGELVDELAAS